MTESNPKGCVTVNNGVVTTKTLKKGITEGKATVQATYNGRSMTYSITVNGNVPQNESMMIDGKKTAITATKTLNLNVGTKKSVTISIPKSLRTPSGNIQYTVSRVGVCNIGEPVYNNADRTKASKAKVEITPMDAGAAYISWYIQDDAGERTCAVAKVIVKKPVTGIEIPGYDATPLSLTAGSGVRIGINETADNTDPKSFTFSVKGKGIKVSRSGYVSAITPGSHGTVTVKVGKISKSVDVNVSDTTNYIALNKTSVSVKIPKASAKKPNTVSLKLSVPKRASDQPSVYWSVGGAPKGISVSQSGIVSVDGTANPGCYVIAADAGGTDGYGRATCEIMVK